jgi:hypothetical protein
MKSEWQIKIKQYTPQDGQKGLKSRGKGGVYFYRTTCEVAKVKQEKKRRGNEKKKKDDTTRDWENKKGKKEKEGSQEVWGRIFTK